MANLITEKQKRTITADYFIRLFTVILFLISILGLFLLAYVIPYYISLVEKDIRVAEQFKSVINAENKENTGESVSRVVSQTLDELKAVEIHTKDAFLPSTIFRRIIENRNFNIKINKISYTLMKKGQGQITVVGLSKNREGLVAFIEDLKSKGEFADVESPVSDFAKDSDIAFTLNIKIAQ
jgi:hypothetical protein